MRLDKEDLKRCPLCGEKVNFHRENSPDGTINWVIISHGPTVPCGIRLIDDESEAFEKWNKRVLVVEEEK